MKTHSFATKKSAVNFEKALKLLGVKCYIEFKSASLWLVHVEK